MMEQGLGSELIPESGSPDRSRIFKLKPLRCLEPMFPSSSSDASPFLSPQLSASFVCTPPTGPFPPGVTPFFPFVSQTASVSVNGSGNIDEEGTQRMGWSKGESSRKKARNSEDGDGGTIDVEVLMVANSFFSSYDLTRFGSSTEVEGDKESVDFILMMFDLLRRKIIQQEDTKGGLTMIARNANLKAGAVLMNKGIRTNSQKRIGPVSGIEVGDIFFFRMELCVVGMHAPPMAGIDYMRMKIASDEESVAVSIISAGGYEENNGNDEDILIYSGQGGNLNRREKDITISDQKLIKGNLALEKSLHRGNDIRVIRGMKDHLHSTGNGKVYFYDGLYRVKESWMEKGKGGYNTFKYKLVRVPGQPQAFTLWKSVQQWKENISSRTGLILTDVTSGAENLPVCLVNEVDNEKYPASFTYCSTRKTVEPINSQKSCNCEGGCQPVILTALAFRIMEVLSVIQAWELF